jgi:hypothetical protein
MLIDPDSKQKIGGHTQQTADKFMFSKFANYEPVIKRGHDMTH